mmetsp:Transcript_52806/g.115198  ORF Transcript_52806/g.115198 Transcript_52806/m.115198 type:complete len:334 (-) Transcript_52806:61-1062(-)
MSSLWHRRRQDKSLAAIQRSEDSSSDATSLSAALISKSYQLHEQIGEGSSGRVYRGLRTSDQMEVALKCLEAKDKEVVQCRKQEFEVLHQLEHPNIVQALDFLTCSKLAVVVLSYNDGSTLDVAVRRAENGYFSEAQSQLLFLQLMQAVEYMHSKRVIHRDIKAENLFISTDALTLQVGDFNTAKALLDGGSLTMTGTMEYAAPEVLEGESPSEQQDVWSSGLCLHIMMTGSLPRRLHSYQTLAAFREAVQSKPIDWGRKQWRSTSENCKDTITKCMAVKKANRPFAPSILRLSWLARPEPVDLKKPRSSTFGYGGEGESLRFSARSTAYSLV